VLLLDRMLTTLEWEESQAALNFCPRRHHCIAVHPAEFGDTLVVWIQAS